MPTREDVARAICTAWGSVWETEPSGPDRSPRSDRDAPARKPREQDFYAAADAAMALLTDAAPTRTPVRRPAGDQHRFQPHHRFTWFCTVCGFGPGERLRHGPVASVLSQP